MRGAVLVALGVVAGCGSRAVHRPPDVDAGAPDLGGPELGADVPRDLGAAAPDVPLDEVAPPVDAPSDRAAAVDVPPMLPVGDDWEWLNPRPAGDDFQAVWSDGTRAWVAGMRGTALYSGDGITWNLSRTGTYARLNGIWGEGETVWAVGEKGTILGSTDGGRSFTAVAASPTTADLYAVWGVGSTVFAVGDGSVVVRGEAGRFQLLPPIEPQPARADLRAVWGRSATDLWAGGSTSRVYHSTDGRTFTAEILVRSSRIYGISGDASNVWAVGAGGYAHFDGATSTWVDRSINPGVAESLWGVWALSPADVFMAGDGGRLWRTTTDGLSRTAIFNAGTPWQLSGIWGQGDRLLVAGGTGTLVRSADHAQSFQSGTIGPHTWQTDDNRAMWGLDEQHLFVAGGNGHVWRSVDAGETWTTLDTGVTGGLKAITGRADGTLVASGGVYAGYSVLIRSRDFGEHWTRAATSPTTTSMILDGNDLWVAQDNRCTVFHSTNLGDSWESFALPSSCISATQIWASGMNVVAGSPNTPIWYSTNKGMTWQPSVTPAGASAGGFWGASPTELWAANFSGTVLRSTDGGASFEARDPAATSHGAFITGAGGAVYLGSSFAVYATRDAGETWQALPPSPYLFALWAGPTHLFGAGPSGAIVRRKR